MRHDLDVNSNLTLGDLAKTLVVHQANYSHAQARINTVVPYLAIKEKSRGPVLETKIDPQSVESYMLYCDV